MKNLRVPSYFFYLSAFTLSLIFASCSSPKQVFYFKSAPAPPKAAVKPHDQGPVYIASTDIKAAEVPPVPDKIETVAISKKELRRLLKQQVRVWKDSVPDRSQNRKVTISGDKQKLKDLKSEVKDFKNSVRVEETDDKVVVNYSQPATDLSVTAKILLAVGALVILIALFSIPVIGPLLAAILAVAVVVAALALILGYVEIHRN